ncbi:MAG: DUF5011 domain-containing protein [Blautia sp.]|nr:DUF5011 domain-containing protein [Blautia sp.]
MKKHLIIILVILCLVMAGGTSFLFMHNDRQAPAIVVMKDGFSYHEGVTMDELLSDVTAVDSRDGDVTSSLQVDDVYANEDKASVSVVYSAKDRSNNTVQTTYVMPVEGSLPDVLLPSDAGKGASDGDNDLPEEEQEKKDKGDDEQESAAEAQADAKDEEGSDKDPRETARREEEEKIEQLRAESPRIRLKEYYIEVPAGTQLDQLSYIDSIEDDTDDSVDLFARVQVYSNVDTAVPGSYEMTYYVLDSNGNQSNMAALRVRVL